MGKRKQAQKKWSRLEQKIEKRKQQQVKLQREIEKIREEQHKQQILILDECEARAIDDRVAYYDQFRVNKKWPRVILDSSQVLPSQINLLELLPLSSDVFRHIVTHLAPREYESFSLTCKSFSELLLSTAFIYNYLDSFIDFMKSNKIRCDTNLLDEFCMKVYKNRPWFKGINQKTPGLKLNHYKLSLCYFHNSELNLN